MYLTLYLKYALIFLVLIVLQVSFMWLLAISKYNIAPDLVIIMVIYTGYSRGQIAGMVSGFIAGLILDILSGSFIGLSALSYSLAGFISGYFFKQTSDSGSKRTSLIGIIFMCTLVAYTIFFIIYFQGSSISLVEIFFKFVITTTIYTSFFGLILALIFNRFDLKKTF
ncbi:MAG: rod shape-determining protein MreD [Bacteroidota bacterium]|nr:rod shape-determining protein MreD [Bacteroidota bacterium]